MMAKDKTKPSFPVESDSVQAALSAALARISEVPAGLTLVDEVSQALWALEISDNIAAGSLNHDENELDYVDTHELHVA